MLTCDKCKKQIEGRRDIRSPIELPYAYVCKAYQKKDFDLCDKCRQKLNEDVIQAKMHFINGTKNSEKRKARWKGAGLGDYYCSLCNETYSGGDTFKYCPNCGAQMYE